MKKVFFILCACVLAGTFESLAQKKTANQNTTGSKTLIRCATMEHLAAWKQLPMAKSTPSVSAGKKNPAAGNGTVQTHTGTKETAGPVYIPVVVHIVLPFSTQVSDADVEQQIAQLNQDFAGLNADSNNIPPAFKPLFAKSKIQFVLARRTPGGGLTSGIERRNSNVEFSSAATEDAIKFNALGGLDAWDASRYFNIWVGNNSSGILGYATFPETDAMNQQGVCINILGWGGNSCYVDPSYNLGRTLVHETGHFFGLYHIWGDDNGCDGDDFDQLTGNLLPAGLFNPPGQGNTADDIGDTPNMGRSTGGCPVGIQTDACSPTAPGRMYQNYMDYTDDACYNMFTTKQVERMEWVLDNLRETLTASVTATLPANLPALDAAATAFVNPGSIETIDCESSAYPSELQCITPITPSFIVTNAGTTTLTSVRAELRVNGQSVSTVTANVNLPVSASAIIRFPSFTPGEGDNILQVTVSSPNNGADQNAANNSIQTTLTVLSPAALPLTEGFEGTTFPPANWSILQAPADDITWQRTTQAAKSGNASAYINNFNYQAFDNTDELIMPRMSYENVDSVFLKFDVAAATYSDPGSTDIPLDTLTVLISTNCGQTFTEVYKKWGTELVTVPGERETEFFPTSTQWRNDSINLTPYTGTTGDLVVKFRNTVNYENNVFIDNVNIYTKTVPVLLKQNGYLIYPNPFSNQVLVQHLQPPTQLKGINVYSATGQLVYRQQYSTAPPSSIYINLPNLASGVYFMRLIYTDKEVTQKLIKLN
ncbi:T9SS-dependent choice-of-anchor J family protein [Foetidibacter luteolus]|uniref:T9SS-dependent choice-of-anchor J family protein n=1 Tax=Foetidibacter luteolus TaxID=2608880 RepID=UPI00129A50BB|nr:choice-of-anchor J domain-containing protein [Foetidibacter luteolus]